MKGRSKGVIRKSFDLTEEQNAAIDEMITRMEASASQLVGVPVKISRREFLHGLLKEKAKELDVEWPENYPTAGGLRSEE